VSAWPRSPGRWSAGWPGSARPCSWPTSSASSPPPRPSSSSWWTARAAPTTTGSTQEPGCTPRMTWCTCGPSADQGHELGRRLRAVPPCLMLGRCRRSDPPAEPTVVVRGRRQMPVLRARGGHGRRGPTAFQHGGDGHKLNWRVRPVRDDHCIFGKPPKAARQAIASGITIARAGCSDLLGLKAVSAEFRALWRQRARWALPARHGVRGIPLEVAAEAVHAGFGDRLGPTGCPPADPGQVSAPMDKSPRTWRRNHAWLSRSEPPVKLATVPDDGAGSCRTGSDPEPP
jgi:hypothetical protein